MGCGSHREHGERVGPVRPRRAGQLRCAAGIVHDHRAGSQLKKYGVTVNAIAPRALHANLVGPSPSRGSSTSDPANIAPVVAAGRRRGGDINGQVFVVFANRVHLMDGGACTAPRDRRPLDDRRLRARTDDLFVSRRRGLPAAGFGS
jgi:hypothetical protein